MAFPSRKKLLALAALGAAAALPLPSLTGGCVPTTRNPYPVDAGADAPDGSGGEGGGGAAGGGPGPDPTLGGPCKTDDDCDDTIACTVDACDLTLEKCRFLPDDAACANAKYCDGVERCDNKLGCTFGEPIGCSDNNPCTLDACVETTKTCAHTKRDADLDGDPDKHCGGGDCDDADPTVNSKVTEVCANFKDDNCDGAADEAACTVPMNDTCSTPLEIDAPGSYAMDTTACALDYPTTCNTALMGAVDAVAALILPPGPKVNVEVTARATYQQIAVALAEQCADPSTEIACGGPYPAPPMQGGMIAKALARNLGDPDAMTALPIYIATLPGGPLQLDVAFLPAEDKPTNETCGTAQPAPVDVPFTVTAIDAAPDLATGCGPATGELVYSFTLANPSNVDIFATSVDGDGAPVLSLRGAGCALPEDEITCHVSPSAHIIAKSLPAGTYYLATAATAPTTMLVTIELSPPTAPEPDDLCDGAPAIAPNKTIGVKLADHQDNVQLGCLPGAVDAAYSLPLTQPSDVLVVGRFSLADTTAVSIVKPTCDAPEDLLACGTGYISPVRTAKHNLPAGDYRIIAESLQTSPMELTAFVRKAVPPVLVPFADTCDDAVDIPATGGFFQGTTANAADDYTAGCDQGGQTMSSPDQMLRLKLTSNKRVILDMQGSSYSTILDVRKGPDCPGTEVPLACAVGYYADRSYLDLKLDAGTYYVQIDGYAGQSGPWFLDVRVVDP